LEDYENNVKGDQQLYDFTNLKPTQQFLITLYRNKKDQFKTLQANINSIINSLRKCIFVYFENILLYGVEIKSQNNDLNVEDNASIDHAFTFWGDRASVRDH
jgi:hypothetical protein